MINEVTKNTVQSSGKSGVKEVPTPKKQDARAVAFGEVCLEKQQFLRASGEELYKCASRDSLSSLQQLVDKAARGPLRRKFLIDDHSNYTHVCTRPERVSTDAFATQTNFLRPRMEFSGYQISGYKKYQIEVCLKTVDLPVGGCSTLTPHMSGFLTIRGLTNQHPEITTYFEAFAVTHRDLGFLSSSWADGPTRSSYRADDQTDLEHWLNFPAFKQLFLASDAEDGSRPTVNDVIEGNCRFGDYLEQRYIFMRWKEQFLVPDAMIDGVAGASYDGFYYIVHDQVTGNIQGFYYHQDAEKFQQLELVPSFKSLADSSNCTFEFA